MLEGILCAISLALLSDAVFPLLRHSAGQTAVTVGGSATAGYLRLLVLVVAAAALAMRAREAVRLIAPLAPLFLLLLLAPLSALWSNDPFGVAKASVGLWAAMLLGVYFGLRFSLSDQVKIVAAVFVSLTIVSVLFAVLEPHLGIDVGPVAGSWRGAFIAKNAFGRAMAFAFTAQLVLFATEARLRGMLLAAIGVTGLLIWLSDSRTSMMIVAVMTLHVLAQARIRRVRIPQYALTLGLAFVVLAVVATAVTIGAAPARHSGDPDLLTGRSRLWAASLLVAMRHPLLGYGFTSFWNGPHGDFLAVWRLVGWAPPHAHNGFIDVALDLGMLGLLLLVMCIARVSKHALDAARERADPLGELWAVCAVLFLLLANLTESTFLRANVYWAVFTAVAVATIKRRPDAAQGDSAEYGSALTTRA